MTGAVLPDRHGAGVAADPGSHDYPRRVPREAAVGGLELGIAFFSAIGTAAGGIAGPLYFGRFIDNAIVSKDITSLSHLATTWAPP